MVRCPKCDNPSEEAVCPRCGCPIPSDPDGTMDALVQGASIPNLAALVKRGKKLGLIQAGTEYGQTA